MTKKTAIVGVLLAGCLFGSGYVTGQGVKEAQVASIKNGFMRASAIGDVQDKITVRKTLQRAAKDPVALQAVTEAMILLGTAVIP